MSLNIGGQLGIADTDIAAIINQWDTFDYSELELAKMGFPPEDKPNFSRTRLTPGALENMTGDQLTNTFTKIVAWHGYASNILMRIRGKLAQIENQMKIIRAQHRKNIRDTSASIGGKRGPSKDSMEDDIVLNPLFQELMKLEQMYDQQRLQIQAHVDSLDTERSLVSRFVEIKRQELEGGHDRGVVKQRAPGQMR